MLSVLCRSKNGFQAIFLVIILITLLCFGSTFNATTASARVTRIHYTSATCLSSAAPTSPSLLVVLLDRSGSLIAGPTTDPNGYSTSVTKALTDLWPGQMAVIPFTGDTTQLPIFGPDTLSDPTLRADLKNKVQNYPIGGDTPLGPAMHEALDLLHQKGNPPGSRVIVITDGNPTGLGNNDGPHQEQDIRKNLIAQFCNQGVPVSAFGLTIDPNTADGQDANRLLSDIAKGTGASYSNVKSPEDLAREVINLYAQWLGLSFTPVQGQGGNFPVSIDTFATQVSIVSFRSDSSYSIKLVDQNGQPVTNGVQKSIDRHYEIDSLNVSGPIIAGTYTVNTGSDPNAQVFALVSSPLQVQLVAPMAKTIAYDNTPVQIQAEFLKGQDILTPSQEQGQIIASVTLLVNGQPAGPPTNDVVLKQQGNTAIFNGQTLIYNQPGQLQIQIQGTYQQVKRQTSFTLQLLKPLPKPPPPPTPCSKGQVQCTWEKYYTQILIFGPLVVLLLLLLIAALVLFIIWNSQPAPFGILSTPSQPIKKTPSQKKRDSDSIDDRPPHMSLKDVVASRPLHQRIFQRSIITSSEMQKHRDAGGEIDFDVANFELVFKGRDIVDIRAGQGNVAAIKIRVGKSETLLENGSVRLYEKSFTNIEGYDGSYINIEKKDRAVFSSK